jgi:hypothetical protein
MVALVLASVPGNGMTAKRTRWLVVRALTSHGALLIRFVVFKDIPVIRIGHMRFRFAGTHTGPGNFVPLKSIVPQYLGALRMRWQRSGLRCNSTRIFPKHTIPWDCCCRMPGRLPDAIAEYQAALSAQPD